MKSLSAQKIRTEFLEYFHGQGHQKVRSSSLIPSNDPTVLLTTAGMQQFKPYFLGEQEPPARRLTTAQKCFRTSDIEEVGDATHDTFFEMLGNFSVGDYFKKEAIAFAWDLLVGEWEIPPERLSITVFGGYESLPPDEEAEGLWKAQDVPAERIFRFGPKDNFWGPPGVTGPCGPCSEIHYDLTQVPCSDPSCGPNCECGRFLEIWNLVFMEYNKQEQGNFDPLPSKNIDTGMGLERIALVLQRKKDIFATDLFAPILEAIEQLCRFSLKDADEAVLRSSRVIADHIRAATFLVSDGVLPSNDGRGYVLRRILRKALVHGRRLGQTEPFVERLLNVVIDNFQAAYPELSDNRVFISRVLGSEEERFLQTLETGIRIFQAEGERMEAAGEKTLPGEVVFRLYDTFGFPPELTEDMAGERGMEVDRPGFDRCMTEQREKARASWRGDQQQGLTQEGALAGVESEFIGYDRAEISSVVTHLFTEGARTEEIGQGQAAQVVCSQTPFYAESGGQVGDQGLIEGPEGIVSGLGREVRAGKRHPPPRRSLRGPISGESGGHPEGRSRLEGARRNETTRQPIFCITRSGPCSATMSVRPAPWWHRIGFGSTSPISPPSRSRRSIRWNPWSTRRSSRTSLSAFAPSLSPRRKPRRRLPCSARSTATSSGW